MHKDTGWRPTPCDECRSGYEVWTHTAPHEINTGQRDPEEMDVDPADDVDVDLTDDAE